MLEFKDKTRLNAPDKGALFRAYKDAEIEAMANFMTGM